MVLQINESIEALKSLGIPLPDWLLTILFLLALFGLVLVPLDKIYKVLVNLYSLIRTHFYNRDDKQFIDSRNNFVKYLEYEIVKLNQEADWNDFSYTELEAEVEVDTIDLDLQHSRNPFVWLHSFFNLIKTLIGISPASRVDKNLIQAIIGSKSRAFLVIGDPGSGKTVSLRHLFLKMADICKSSKSKDAIVPIYLNLKHLNMEPDDVSPDKIHGWIIEYLRAHQDRIIHEFLSKNFDLMLKNGTFFFLFDSFDEIPAVMDAREENVVVYKYSKALDGFLFSQPCRGLVSSRPYREPKTFLGQRMVIRPLEDKRIEKALNKYLTQEASLADRLWQQLVQHREDMLYIARNPFYLGLLAGYAKEKKELPDRNYDLFEYFVQTRASKDEDRLHHFGLKPDELIERASILAFAMTQTSNIGLEVDITQVGNITRSFDKTKGWDPNKVEQLLDALCYSKIGRMSQDEPGTPRVFSFVHRRFHEYFCARFIRQNPQIAPIERLVADDRWREVLVLLCEVLPSENLTTVFEITRYVLSAGIGADSGSVNHRKAIETIRFLRDGFRSRIEDLPGDIRLLCSKFISKQLEQGNLLDKKRAIEGVSIVDNSSIHSILEPALNDNSAWLQDTAIKSCRILRSVSPQIAVAIRRHFFHRYADLKIHTDYASYSVLFTSPPALNQFKSFLNILIFATLLQGLFYFGIAVYGFLFDLRILIGILIGLLISSVLIFVRWVQNFRSESNEPLSLRKTKIMFDQKLRTILDRFFDFSKEQNVESFSDSIEIVLSSYWVLLAFSILFMIPFSQSVPVAKISFSVFVLVLLFNGLLAGLISNYPDSILAWLLYPIRISIKMVNGFKTLLFQLLRNGKALKFFGLVGIVWGLAFLIFKGIELAERQNFSYPNIYSTYGSVLATSIMFSLLIGILFVLLFAIGFLTLIWRIILFFVWIAVDQSKLMKFSFISENRPKTAKEAIQILYSLKSELGKARFISGLFKWLPIGADPQILIEEASRHRGVVRDRLYQLAEVWEDSVRGKK